MHPCPNSDDSKAPGNDFNFGFITRWAPTDEVPTSGPRGDVPALAQPREATGAESKPAAQNSPPPARRRWRVKAVDEPAVKVHVR